jgi:hypothetical protein
MMIARPRTRLLLAILLPVIVLLALGQITNAENRSRRGGVLALTGTEREITLAGRYASFRVLVEERRDGRGRDVSDAVTLRIADPRIARVADGTVWAVRDGSTVLTARWNDQTISTPVRVRGVAAAGATPPRFATDVVPVLTKAGCSQGGCHGAAAGKGGFKLSLQGYDP